MAMTLEQAVGHTKLVMAGHAYNEQTQEAWQVIQAHLSAQAEVKDEDVERLWALVANDATTRRMIRDFLNSFAARLSQGAQGESTVSEDEWVQKLEKRVEFLESLLSAEREAVPDVDRMRNALDWIAENTVASHAFDDSMRIIHNVARNALSSVALTATHLPPDGARVADGWQPIETAPKGGKDILVWNEASAMFQIALWVPTMGCWLTDEDRYVDSDELSHWHPLPAAPTLAGKEGA